jgi:hypothetical protein
MAKKENAMSMAIVDYAMLAVSRWISAGYPNNPRDRTYRAFREIAPSLSLLYSMEDGKLVTRKVSPPNLQ